MIRYLHRLTKRPVIFLLAILIILLNFLVQSTTQTPKQTVKPEPKIIEKDYVTKVIDGDTIEIEGGKRVRYIGINTPELKHPNRNEECFGQEAYQKNKELMDKKFVYLEKDVSETDKFGRLLRYAYLDDPQASKSALFINEYLVKEGFALASTFPPDVKHVNLFLKAQNEARTNKKGLWNKCF